MIFLLQSCKLKLLYVYTFIFIEIDIKQLPITIEWDELKILEYFLLNEKKNDFIESSDYYRSGKIKNKLKILMFQS